MGVTSRLGLGLGLTLTLTLTLTLRYCRLVSKAAWKALPGVRRTSESGTASTESVGGRGVEAKGASNAGSVTSREACRLAS